MGMITEANIRHASPNGLSRLHVYLVSRPQPDMAYRPPNDLETLQNEVLDHLGVVRHTCVFRPSWLKEYRICSGCGDVLTDEEWKKREGL